MSLLLLVLVILLVLALVGGGVTYNRCSYGSFSPVAVILLILLVLWLAGYLR
jgi:hypothetical protein